MVIGEGMFSSLDNKPILGSAKIKTNEFCKEITKTRYIEQKNNHLFIRIDKNDDKYGHFFINDIENVKSYDAVIISDYNKGYLTENDIKNISISNLTFLDSKRPLDSFAEECAFIKVNSSEYKKAKNITLKMKNKMIITLGANGTWFNNKIYSVPSVEIKNLSGCR